MATNGIYFKMFLDVCQRKDLTPLEKMCWAWVSNRRALADRQNEEARFTARHVARNLGCSVDTVKHALSTLKDKGLVQWAKRGMMFHLTSNDENQLMQTWKKGTKNSCKGTKNSWSPYSSIKEVLKDKGNNRVLEIEVPREKHPEKTHRIRVLIKGASDKEVLGMVQHLRSAKFKRNRPSEDVTRFGKRWPIEVSIGADFFMRVYGETFPEVQRCFLDKKDWERIDTLCKEWGLKEWKQLVEHLAKNWPRLKRKFKLNGAMGVALIFAFRQSLLEDMQGVGVESSSTHRYSGRRSPKKGGGVVDW